MSACLSEKLSDWMDCWQNLCPAVRSNRVWRVAFHAVCCTIWEFRNEVVFKQGVACLDMAVEMVLWRIAWWFKTLGPGSQLPTSVLMMNLKVGCVDNPIICRKDKCPWSPPLDGILKFNVDGSSRGNPGPSGIGGIMRDSKGDILCIFSSYIGFGLSTLAEIQAILKACQLCVSDCCPFDVRIIIESDSMVAVSWVNGNSGVGNVSLMDYILDIKEIVAKCKPRLSVTHVYRTSNVAADFLSKQGGVSYLDQVVWA
ncbi:hypothetical protein Q3G72_014539 [Acer saccharum]|nr:hypothetical protein Q3G72_014539 [Acer saccharum]